MSNEPNALKQFEQALLFLARTVGIHNAFSDFLDYSLLFFSWPTTKPQDFLVFDQKYNQTDWQSLFAQAFAAMGDIADNHGAGFKDPFGDFFMEHLSQGKNGQYFTPEDMCDMMAIMSIGSAFPDGKKIADPACGSGRILLSAAKINRNALFYGADLDLVCCKMTVINMALNSMRGEVAWMNTLSMKHYRSWRLELACKIPYCFEIPREQSVLANFPVVNTSTASQPSSDNIKRASEKNDTTSKSRTTTSKKNKKGNDSQLQFLFD